jgi:hypothetical protein
MPEESKHEKKAEKQGKEAKSTLTDKERLDKGQVLARVIIEVLGAPKEYVEEAIGLVVDKVHEANELEVVSESTFEAEEKGKLFSSFSEIEIWFKDMDLLSRFLFEFTPSSVPSKMMLKASFISGFLNDSLLKMHEIGLKLKDSAAKAKLVEKNTDVLMRNFFHLVLKEPRSTEEIAKLTGVPEGNTKAILANFEKAGVVTKKDDLYVLSKSEANKKR